MNKLILLSISILLAFSFTHFDPATSPIFHWGKTVALPFNGSIELPKPIRIDENGVVAIQERRSDNLVDYWFQFDTKLNRTRSNKMAFNRGSEGNTRHIVDYLVIEDKIHLLYETWKKNTFEHALQRVELKSNFEPSIRKNTVDQIYASKEDNVGTFQPLLTADKSRLLIFGHKPFDKKLNERNSIRVYHTDTWKLDWKYDIDHDHLSVKDIEYQAAISDQGGVCFFKLKQSKKINYAQFIFANKNQGKYVHDLTLNDKKLTDIKVDFTPDNHPVAIGTYEKKISKNKKSYGIFMMKLSKDGSVVNSQEFIDIENEETWINLKMNYDPNNDDITNGLKLIDFYQKADGQILIVSEIYQNEKQLINTKDKLLPNNIYEHGNVFIHCINSLGLQEWVTTINKYQKETATGDRPFFSSILPHFVEDKLIVIWNNTELVLPFSNWEQEGVEKTIFKKDLFGGSTYYPSFLEVIDGSGKKQFEHLKYGLPLADMHEETPEMLSLRPDLSYPTENGLVIMAQATVSPSIFRMGKIDFSPIFARP